MTRDELVVRMARALYKFERGTDPYADQDWDESMQRYYARLIAAALTELEKHAVVVPAEATEGMIVAGHAEYQDGPCAAEMYRAMLAARPR